MSEKYPDTLVTLQCVLNVEKSDYKFKSMWRTCKISPKTIQTSSAIYARIKVSTLEVPTIQTSNDHPWAVSYQFVIKGSPSDDEINEQINKKHAPIFKSHVFNIWTEYIEEKRKLVDVFNVCLNDLGVNLKGGFSNDT